MRQRFTLNSYKSSVDLSEKIVKHASSHSFGDLSASNRDLTTYSSTRQAVKIEDIGFNQLKETTDHELTTSVGKLVSTSAIGQDRSELSATEIDPQCNQLDLESLKIDLYSLTKKASEKTSQLSFYDFLLSHCFKLKRFLVSESAAIGDVQTELQTLAFLSADKPQIFEVFTVWGKLQVALLDHFSRIEENHKQKTASFEAMEKKVLKLEKTVQERFENNTQETAKDSQTLFKTKPEVANTPVATSVFASLPPATSTPTKKDIKPSANSGTVPNSPKAESSARQLRHPVSRASRSMQTDAKILIDATTGPNDVKHS